MLQDSCHYSVPKTYDYYPVALTSTVMKCFERLVRVHIWDTITIRVDPHLSVHWNSQTTSDALAVVVHQALSHLERRDASVSLLFLDFSSAFNMIIPV